MSKNNIGINLVFRMVEKEMPNLYKALGESEALFMALRGIGFRGWDRVLNDQGIIRRMGEEVFDDDVINVHFRAEDFVERSDAWGTVVALIKDRGKALDQFTSAQSQLERTHIQTEFIAQTAMETGRASASLEQRKQNRDLFIKRGDAYQERGYARIVSLDESDELKNLPTKPFQHPRVGQMYLDGKAHKVFVWNGKTWKDSGDRVKDEESRY